MRVKQVVFIVGLLHVGVLVDLDLAEGNVIVGVLFIKNTYKQSIRQRIKYLL